MEQTCVPFCIQELKGNWAILLVDRYKYLDLYPCNNTELLSMGYPASYSFIPNGSYVCFIQVKDKEGKVDLYRNQQGSRQHNWLLARPDVNQMMPFKPSSAKGW